MRRAHVAVLMIGLSLLAGIAVLAGCAPSQSDEVCNTLTNCQGLELSQAEKDQVLQVCPLGLMALRYASPACYDCVVDNTCNAPDACLQVCGDLINQVLPGTVSE